MLLHHNACVIRPFFAKIGFFFLRETGFLNIDIDEGSRAVAKRNAYAVKANDGLSRAT